MMDREQLEKIVREVVMAQLQDVSSRKTIGNGVTSIKLSDYKVRPEDRLDTGNSNDQVYCRDLFSLEESPRLGCGIMEMTDSSFNWHLEYDEIDQVIEGELSVIIDGETVTAGPGELILIPKGSKIIFSVKGHARFTYTTFPADWNS